MKASEMISKVDKRHDNNVDLPDKLEWIHDVEKAVYSQIIADPYEVKISIVNGQQAYDMEDYTIEEILQLKVNGTEYALVSALTQQANTYFKLNGKLCLMPIPKADTVDGLCVIRRWMPTEIPAEGAENYEKYDLLLPDAYLEVYEYYLRSKISFEQKDAAEANAWGALYTQAIKEFTAWYVSKQPAKFTNKGWK